MITFSERSAVSQKDSRYLLSVSGVQSANIVHNITAVVYEMQIFAEKLHGEIIFNLC